MADNKDKLVSYDDSETNYIALLHLIYLPLICYGNIIIITACVLVSRFQTVDYYLLLPLAIVDFIIGAVIVPKQIVVDLSTVRNVLRKTPFTCRLWYIVTDVSYSTSLSYLTNIIVFKSISVNYPFFYIRNINGATVIGVSLIILAITCGLIVPFEYHAYIPASCNGSHEVHHVGTDDDYCNCNDQNVPEFFMNKMKPVSTTSHILLSCALCLQLTLVVRRASQDSLRARKSVSTFRPNKSLQTSHLTPKKYYAVNALLFLYILLWMPTMVMLIVNSITGRTDRIMSSIARQCRLFNSAVNVFVYGFVHVDRRKAYIFLFTNPPWKWSRLKVYMRTYFIGCGTYTDCDRSASYFSHSRRSKNTRSRRHSDNLQESKELDSESNIELDLYLSIDMVHQ